MEYEFVIDAYTEARGAPALLEIVCARCSEPLIVYQKDGGGPLIRCYWDRILAPSSMNKLHRLPTAEHPLFFDCPACLQHIGEKITYEKEKRLAFHLVEGSFLIKS